MRKKGKLWNHETMKQEKPPNHMKPQNVWNLAIYENLSNHETYQTTKPMKPRNLWHHETHETAKPIKSGDLWNYVTHET